jgi:hypothetical protein
MKISNFLSVAFFCVMFLVYSCTQSTSQQELKSDELPVIEIQYFGPTNTNELVELFNSTTNKVLRSLSESTKESLITNMKFSDGLYRGMKAKDANIQKLYDSNFVEVLSAILQTDVIENNNPVKHNYRAVNLVKDKPNSTLISSHQISTSECNNCFSGAATGCCEIPGPGCCDYTIVQ